MRRYALAIAAAAFFGASFPLSKLLLRALGPVGLAGLLYLGCGLGVGALRMIINGRTAPREATLKSSDLGWLGGVVLAGGVAGPILLLLGLSRTSAHVSALLANTETIFTMVLAVVFFGGFLLRRGALGAAPILSGATLGGWAGVCPGGAHSCDGPLFFFGAAFA